MNDLTIKSTVSGEYKYRLIKKDLLGREYVVEESDWVSNVITNNGLDLLFGLSGATSLHSFCYIGIGASNASEFDVRMDTLFDTTIYGPTYNSTQEVQTIVDYSSQYISTRTFRYRFNPPPIDSGGRNITEVGIGAFSPIQQQYIDGLSLFSRTNLAVFQSTDQYLDIIYKLTYNFGNDYISNILLNGNTHSIVGRPAQFYGQSAGWNLNMSFFNVVNIDYFWDVNSWLYNGTIGTARNLPTGASNYQTSYEVGTYIAGSYTNYIKVNFDLNTGNFVDGISAFFSRCINISFQFGFTPPILKTKNQTLALTINLLAARG